MITYLAQHKTIAILLLTVYFLGLVYFHDAATIVADWLKYKLTLRYYNLTLLLSGLVFSFATGYYLWRRIMKHREYRILFQWFLNPYFKYFDFNDIVLNMLGAGAGLLVMAAASFPESQKPCKWYRSSSYFFIGIIILLGIIISGNFPVTFFPVPVDHNGWHWLSLYRQNIPDQFWTYLYGSRYYHILRPWEGIMIMVGLTIIYARIDYLYIRDLDNKPSF